TPSRTRAPSPLSRCRSASESSAGEPMVPPRSPSFGLVTRSDAGRASRQEEPGFARGSALLLPSGVLAEGAPSRADERGDRAVHAAPARAWGSRARHPRAVLHAGGSRAPAPEADESLFGAPGGA